MDSNFINITLVTDGLRKSAYLEKNGLSKEEICLLRDLSSNIYVDEDNYGIFISKIYKTIPNTSAGMAKALEYFKVDKEFWNDDILRISGKIYQENKDEVIEITAEVYKYDDINIEDFEKYLNNKVKKWSNRDKNLYWKTEIILPKEYFIARYKNKEFVLNHVEEYMNLIYNYGNEKSMFLDKNNINKHFDDFKNDFKNEFKKISFES